MEGARVRVIIVDDEPLARERIRTLLSRDLSVQIVCECDNATHAIAAIRSMKPDLIFLDIQMPEKNGFDVVSEIGPDDMPAVIFCTAYDEFAVRAFEVNAVDYLLKPFDRGRLKQALDRVVERLGSKAGTENTQRLNALLAEIQTPAQRLDRIAVKTAGKVVLISVPDIDWVGSADNYVEIHVGSHSHLLRETMTSIAGRLPPEIFVRISRTSIVNVNRVKELEPMFHGEYTVVLKDGARLTMSRSHRDQLPRLGVT